MSQPSVIAVQPSVIAVQPSVIAVQPGIITTNFSEPEFEHSNGWIWFVTIFVLIIFVIIVFIMVTSLTISKKDNQENEPCLSGKECAAKHYCGGDNKCHSGVGREKGQNCDRSTECLTGLKCVQHICSGNS